MSRWSRKTDEEKEATRRRIEANSRPKCHKWELGFANEIYAKGQIPMMCPKCGWTFSYQYRAIDKKDDWGLPIKRIMGQCVNCEKQIARAFPSIISPEAFVFASVAAKLVEDGRFTDDRNEDKNVQSKWHRKRLG